MGVHEGCKGSPRERLLAKIKMVTSGCWEFQPKTNNSGYGSLWLNKVRMMAHRASWIIFNGPIPKGLCVCHHCDNTRCVNPKHLFLGTHSDNMKDAVAKGRTKHPGQSYKTHCKRGHKFNAENTRYSHRRTHRACRACHRDYMRNRRNS